MNATVRYVDFKKYNRVIVISDIHGDKDGFKGVLDQVGFSAQDALVIVGDILEKGKYSLELLREVMVLYERGNLYIVKGNNDTIFEEWYGEQVSLDDVVWYVNNKENTILKDMARELDHPCETKEDIASLKDLICREFCKELQFLEQLPHIIDCEFATFVHAGLAPGNPEEQDAEFCLTTTEFASQMHVFEKNVIVGHWPSSNYSDMIIEANVYRNPKTNVISMDGGNSMKRWRQINYLILDAFGRELECGYYDSLPKVRILEDQPENKDYYSLIFPHTEVEIKKREDDKVICYVPWLGYEITLDANRIYEYKRKTYCSDMTTYDLPVKSGEVVSFCGMTVEGAQMKKNGIVGNYHGKYVKVD